MKKYQIIYADPPWKYDFSPKAGSSIERHYSTLSLEEICNLPISKIADNDCYLFLWASMPKIEEALKVIKGWGFRYRTTAFVWVKTSKQFPQKPRYLGTGCYTRPNVEVVLLARNGSNKIKLNNKKVKQVIMLPRTKHSEKPKMVREKIVEMMGDLSRIELFARKPKELFEDISFKGWDVWGNEVESNIEL